MASGCEGSVILNGSHKAIARLVATMVEHVELKKKVTLSGGVESKREAERLSRRILSLPCDFRYQVPDLLRVVEAVGRALETRSAARGRFRDPPKHRQAVG